MGWLDFIASMTGSLAWPIAFVVAVFAFRTQIRVLFSRINQIGFGDAKATFSNALDKVEEKVESLPEPKGVALSPLPFGATDQMWMNRFTALLTISPNAAIIETFGVVERLMQRVISNHKIALPEHARDPKAIANELAIKGLIPLSAANVIYTLAEMRNRAAHGTEATATDALRFRDLANRIGRVLFSAGVKPDG